jgi:murein DD-endopeptidase MepM/ murein hydrolase activator NlpD
MTDVRHAVTAALVLISASAALAGEMQPARMTPTPADWNAAAAALPDKDAASFGKLNAALGTLYPGIAQSPVPVLLPLDPAALLRDPKPDGADAPLAGFRATKFFLAGPAGYDASFTIDSGIVPNIAGSYARPVEVEISGAAFVYELDTPSVFESPAEPKGLDEFPGIRRILREQHVRYAFERFGVPYVVSIECFDQRPRPKRLACKDADQVAIRFLHALHVTGGTAPAQPATPQVDVSRPQTRSLSFTYYPSGNLIQNTGYRQLGGRADDHVYARIRFPLAEAPAFAKSQSFNPWGDCYRTGRNGHIGHKGERYACKRNGLPLVFDEASPQNFSYPWRDNFCETRDRQVGQCPGGWGHQGQDIRPSSCVLRNPESDRCEPYQHDVVAIHDGMVWRTPGQVAAYVVANDADIHLRGRYIHMNPKRMDADGLFSGRRVRQGDVIGQVGTYDERERGTSYHLHFDMQVMTRDGWVWVNPYTTLIAAYEHLIGARGAELPKDEPPPAPKPAPAPVAAETPAPMPASVPLPEPAPDTRVAEKKLEEKKLEEKKAEERKTDDKTFAEHKSAEHAHKATTEPRAERKKRTARHLAKTRHHVSQSEAPEEIASQRSY